MRFNRLLKKSIDRHFVMLNLFQSRSKFGKTLKQVQGDASILFQQPAKSPKFKFQDAKLSVIRYPVCVIFMLFTLCSMAFAAEIRDRVVAFVDNAAITLSELEAKYAETIKIKPDITKEEVLNTMVNRVLLLREARKIYLAAPSEEELIKEYVDLKIRAFIRIPEEKIMSFYKENIVKFEGKEFDDVRDEIENYLVENETNQLLKSHVDELKKASCVKIQL